MPSRDSRSRACTATSPSSRRSAWSARIVTTDDFARYELAEDLTEHHHHLICSTCGDVADFSLQPSVEEELDRALRKVARRTSFAVDGHRLDLVGICSSCR